MSSLIPSSLLSGPSAGCSPHDSLQEAIQSFHCAKTLGVEQKKILQKIIHLLCASDLAQELLWKQFDRLRDQIPYKSLFGTTSKIEVLHLLIPLFENKGVLKKYIIAVNHRETLHNEILLWYAVLTGDIDLAQTALDLGAQVNRLLYPGMSALLLACKQGDCAMTSFLLKKKANAQFIGGTHQHETPLSEALLRIETMRACLPELIQSDAGFTWEFDARKKLAHIFSQKAKLGRSSLDNQLFYFEGRRTRYTLKNYLDLSIPFYGELKQQCRAAKGSLWEKITAPLSTEAREKFPKEDFCTAIDTMLLTLRDCLELEVAGLHANPQAMLAHAIQRLKKKKPVVCFGVTRIDGTWKSGAPNSHAWGIVIAKDPHSKEYRVQVCNRGYGAAVPGILEKKMSYSQALALIEKYYLAAHWKGDFSQIGDSLLLEIARQFQESAVTKIDEKGQDLGNCCYYSAQSIELALLRALLSSLFEQENITPFAKAIKTARTLYTRQEELGCYLHRHANPIEGSHFPLDIKLLLSIWNKVEKKAKLEPFRIQLLSYSLLLDPMKQNHALQLLWKRIHSDPSIANHPFAPYPEATAEEIRSFFKFIASAPEINTLDCSFDYLHAIPLELHYLEGLTTLHLNKCMLSDAKLPFLPHLKQLHLSDNLLKHFECAHLTQLEDLSLQQNRFTQFHMPPLKHLTTLNISYNQLTEIDLPTLPELKSLSLVSNRLTEIRLPPFPKIENLHLTNNLLERVHLQAMPLLTLLFLNNNRLTTLPLCTLEPPEEASSVCSFFSTSLQIFGRSKKASAFPKLELLSLSSNRISLFEMPHLPNLQEIDLYDNPIEEIPTSIPPKVKLTLSTNPVASSAHASSSQSEVP